MKIISLGWGVQSFTLAAMSATGVLPPVDAAVHADTRHERRETYEFAERWTPWLEKRGLSVFTVRGGRPMLGQAPNYTSIPAFTTWPNGQQSGMLWRECTADWKIDPMRRWCREELKRQKLKLRPGAVVKYLGITLDEIERMAHSKVKYVRLEYPFIQMFDKPMTRGAALQWLHTNKLEIPVKSSCVFCPYHDRATWREIRNSGNGDWEKALAADRAIRNARPGYLCYLTSDRLPLEECDFRSQEDHGQLPLWSAEECTGMCFL